MTRCRQQQRRVRQRRDDATESGFFLSAGRYQTESPTTISGRLPKRALRKSRPVCCGDVLAIAGPRCHHDSRSAIDLSATSGDITEIAQRANVVGIGAKVDIPRVGSVRPRCYFGASLIPARGLKGEAARRCRSLLASCRVLRGRLRGTGGHEGRVCQAAAQPGRIRCLAAGGGRSRPGRASDDLLSGHAGSRRTKWSKPSRARPGHERGVIRSRMTPGPVHAPPAQVVRAFNGDGCHRH